MWQNAKWSWQYCWPLSSKKIFEENLFYSTYLSYFFQDMKPEPHIFCNVQNRSEKCQPIGNFKIWLEFFSTTFWLQASAVLVNQVTDDFIKLLTNAFWTSFWNWQVCCKVQKFILKFSSQFVNKKLIIFPIEKSLHKFFFQNFLVHEFFFFLFPLRDFYFCFPSPRHLSNGPSLTEKPHLTMAAPPSFSL